jgi:hypothetical protein
MCIKGQPQKSWKRMQICTEVEYDSITSYDWQDIFLCKCGLPEKQTKELRTQSQQLWRKVVVVHQSPSVDSVNKKVFPSFPGHKWPRRHLPWEFISLARTHVNLRFDFFQQKNCHWKWSNAANQYEFLSETIQGLSKGHMGYLGYKEFLLPCSADLYATYHLCWELSSVLNICLGVTEMDLASYMQQE